MSERAGSQAGAPSFAALLRERYDEVAVELAEGGRAGSPVYIATLSEEELLRRAKMTLDGYLQSLAGEPETGYADLWRRLSYLRFSSGVPLDHIQKIVLACNAVIWGALKRALAGDPVRQVEAAERCAAIAESGILSVYTAYEQAREALIAAQRARITQLSTPIIPVHEGILVVPLIGSLDADRGAEMIERMLEGISRARAEVVIIDVTGVPVVDIEVAGYLIRAARSAELLGAKSIFVGVRPAIAQALVGLGADLGGLTTLANLQAGIARALRLRGLAIRPHVARG